MRDTTKVQLNRIMDTFSGGDGGVSFLKLKVFIEQLDEKAAQGDYASQEILDRSIVGLSRLIELVITMR